jgi:very-short-patch-repair endonuclease
MKHLEYVKLYLEDFPIYKKCIICGEKTGNISKYDTCSRKCYKINMSNIMIKRGPIGPMSEEHKKHVSESKIGKPNYKLQGRTLSDELKNKISNTQKNRIERDGSWWSGKNHTDMTKKKISDTRISKGLAKGSNNGMYGKTHTAEAVMKIMSHRKMNKFEEAVSKELDTMGFEYHFQFFITENDICKSYDFKLKGLPIIIESDGDFWHGNPNAKHHWKDSDSVIENDILKEDLANKRGYTIIRIWQSEFYKNKNILKDKLNSILKK